jgi:hypothetical protein
VVAVLVEDFTDLLAVVAYAVTEVETVVLEDISEMLVVEV